MTTEHQPVALFSVGNVMMTAGLRDAVGEQFNATYYLYRHVTGDWGNVCKDDAQANEYAIANGLRIISVYHFQTSTENIEFYVITEADRSATTFLLKHEY